MTYGAVNACVHVVFTSALQQLEVSGQLQAPAALTPRAESWVGPT
jgi:hypothetical protein